MPLISRTFNTRDLSAETITANVLTANTITSNTLSGIDTLDVNSITVGNQNIVGGAYGIETSQADFEPITQSGIRDIVVQGQGIAFNGTTFPGIGTYSYMTTNVDAFVNRNDTQTSYIPDLDIAYCNDPSGNVVYSFDMVILYPTDASKYSGFMAVEGANRGQASMCFLEDSSGVDLYSNTVPRLDDDGTSVPGTGCGNGFRYLQGDMIVYVGWEANRPQSLSNAVVQYYADSANVSGTNSWPGQSIANVYSIPRGSVGLGTTLPLCYSDASFNELMSGTCTDYGYFVDSSAGIDAQPSRHNLFSLCYPIMPVAYTTMTIAINTGTYRGTPIPIDSNLWSNFEGYGLAGLSSVPYKGTSGIVPSDSSGYPNVLFVPALSYVFRNAIMRGKDGTPMHTSNTSNYTKYYTALQADASGFLRDYGSEYALTYTGVGSRPALLGQLGIRDVVSYLRYGTSNLFIGDSGFWSAYSGKTSNAMMWGYAQSGELVRAFMYNGFNVSRSLQPIFDCCFVSHTGVNRRASDGYRFSKPNEEPSQHFGYTERPSEQFPFTYQTTIDPISGTRDGILMKYTRYPGCTPLVYHCISSYDMYSNKASLLFTDSYAQPLTQPDNVQFFFILGAPQTMTFSYSNVDLAAPITPVEGVSQGESPVAQTFVFRSCYWYLKNWARTSVNLMAGETAPLFGTITNNSFSGIPNTNKYFINDVSIVPVGTTTASMNWVDLSNIVVTNSVGTVVNRNGLAWNGNQYTPHEYVTVSDNVNTSFPVYGPGLQYTVVLSSSDESFGGPGNDIFGVYTPEINVPLLTVKGYNTYIRGYGVNDTVYLGTSAIPMSANVATKFDGDNRPTIEDFYESTASWLDSWTAAVSDLVSTNQMLDPSIFPYDYTCYTNRGTYQASLLNTVHGLSNT
jgi:hypothetical protein